METYFTPAVRSTPDELKLDIARVSNNPVIDGLMHSVGSVLAVLNSARQILAVNNSLLDSLGLAVSRDAIGLRPGEALKCMHAHEAPHGCGTTKHCATCGAAIAIATSLETNMPVERKCIIRAQHNGVETDVCFLVRACPVTADGHRYLLLFMQDTTIQEKRAALERAFFHDINNILSGLLGASELLLLKHDGGGSAGDLPLVKQIKQMSLRLANEITIQRSLLHSELSELRPVMHIMPVADLLTEVQSLFASHSAATEKILHIDRRNADTLIRSDGSLLIRILSNMLTNAFEASELGDTVRLWLEEQEGRLCFCVWNGGEIDEAVRLRIFQRYISTKQGVGRGTGTYTMKLFGETFLGGRVDFSSSAEDGTIFRLCLPISPPPGNKDAQP
ncbi:MAG: ATP-binding protein [Desulfurivibrionaceae bacterium]|jgi:nitrogen-specific signal transduction histidine kinase